MQRNACTKSNRFSVDCRSGQAIIDHFTVGNTVIARLPRYRGCEGEPCETATGTVGKLELPLTLITNLGY